MKWWVRWFNLFMEPVISIQLRGKRTLGRRKHQMFRRQYYGLPDYRLGRKSNIKWDKFLGKDDFVE